MHEQSQTIQTPRGFLVVSGVEKDEQGRPKVLINQAFPTQEAADEAAERRSSGMIEPDIFDIIGDPQKRKGRFLEGSENTFDVSGGEGLQGIFLEGSKSPFLFDPKLHTAKQTPGTKDSVTLSPAKQPKEPQIKTIGELRKVSQALKGVPEAIRTKVLSRLTGIPEKDTGMEALNRILFKHKLEAPQRADVERRFQQTREDVGGRAKGTAKRAEESLDLREREFDFRQQTSDKKILDMLKQIAEVREKIKFSKDPQSASVRQTLNMLEARLLLGILSGRAKITKRK